jgi:hypothetical protein
MFYNKLGVKVVPANIGKLLNPVGLAYWFADYGYFHKASSGFYLSTNSFDSINSSIENLSAGFATL